MQKTYVQRIQELTLGYAPTLIVEAALHHGIFELLNSGPHTEAEICEGRNLSHRGGRSILNALVGMGFLKKDDAGRLALSDESKALLVSSHPGFQGGLISEATIMITPWLHLFEIVRTGRPHQSLNDERIGAHRYRNSVAHLFPLNYGTAQAVALSLGISRSRQAIRVIDIGAGSGVWGIGFAKIAKDVMITFVDWEAVIEVAKSTVQTYGLLGRATFIGGDIQTVPLGDGYHIAILGHVLHGEGPRKSQGILRRAFDSLVPGGTLVIAEYLVDATRSSPLPSLILAVSMLVNTDEGDIFSFGEIEAWLQSTGFVDVRLSNISGASRIILAAKPSSY